MKEEFALFIDDSGSAKPNPQDPYPLFAMGGVLLKRADETQVQKSIEDFKKRWNIPLEVPLHGNEIRSKKKRFAWLGKLSEEERETFMDDLTGLIINSPITVVACVISRQGYFNRYLDKYGEKTWEMMKSAFTILIERTAKHVASQDGTLMVYYEKMGEKKDKLIEGYYKDLKTKGLPFDPSSSAGYSPLSSAQFNSLLRGIEGKSKNRAEIQLADLCLYPVANSKSQPENKAFQAMKNNQLLVDCKVLPRQLASLGIKYYCFD